MARSRSALALGALAWAHGYDLDPCASKATFTVGSCPSGTSLACWSASAALWACWPAPEAPAWSAGALAAEAACRARPVASGTGSYDGACTFPDPTWPAPLEALPAPLPWDVAYAQAEATLALMEPAEKFALMRGVGWFKPPDQFFELEKWYYVGNTAAIPRLGIPSMNIQDAAGGFRTYWNELVGTVTSWPSQLALAATWDPAAVRELAVAMGQEFAGKGANAILGPSVNVHRVARNGRNFEYLSGEDPYLGARLAKAYVEGIHSQGLLTVAKHWIFNDQETNRDWQSSVVDDKTAWELYYPPFQAAVEAGVSAMMCSYNKVDGDYSCSNQKQLQVLKERMGFRGFVQSDWWASHNTSVPQGLDQEMPGLGFETYFSDDRLKQQDLQLVDESAKRMLAAVHRMNLSSTTKCTPPDCASWFQQNVTSAEHAALARTLAAESVVLLKNKGGVLPFSASVRTIAVVGAPAIAGPYNPNGVGQGQGNWWQGDYYAGGGSGHVTAGYVVTPLEGISRRAALAGIAVLSSPSDDVAAALVAARQADVVVVVAATTSGESMDRPHLHLDGGADGLVGALAAEGHTTVVLMQVPGAVVMPWRDAVAGALAMFLGGQETGAAWADVLFGDHAPTGRLPIMLPATEADTVSPGYAPEVVYSEGLATSYRNQHFAAAFPFGHGLTYTTFEYLQATSLPCGGDQGCVFCVAATVRNSGPVPGRTVAQLYLELPPEAGQPAAVLKGFQKTGVLLPDARAEVSFCLADRDLSYYDPAAASWTRISGNATAHIGESAADVRLSLPLSLGAGAAGAAGAAGGAAGAAGRFLSAQRAAGQRQVKGLFV